MGLGQALLEFLLGQPGNVPSEYEGSELLLFSLSGGTMGFLAVVLDWILYSVRGKSFFDLSYGQSIGRAIRLVLLWSIGAGIGAFLGGAFDIFEISRAAAVSVGVGWPLILPRLVDSFTSEQLQQEPTDGNQNG